MTVLITGASSGIGRSLARLFARGGYDVVLVARREGPLTELARELEGLGRTARVVAADLAEPGSAGQLYEQLQRDGVSIDVLVNNAGVGMQGPFAELPLDRQLAMIQLNVTSLTALTGLMLPAMRARNQGGILNVASTAAFQPGPLMAVYYASKAYVLSFTEALAEELAGSALKVTCLAPGPTDTEFAAAASMTGSRLFKGGAMTAEAVAAAAFDGWNARKRLVIPGTRNRIAAFAVKLAPRNLVVRSVKSLNTVD